MYKSMKKCISFLICMFLAVVTTLANLQLNIQAEQLLTYVIDDSDIGNELYQVQYNGVWDSGPNSACYKETEHWTTPNMSDWTNESLLPSYTIRFKGERIELYGQMQPNLGIYEVFIDGEFKGLIDAHQEAYENQKLLFESDPLADGEHVITVKMTHTKNEASNAYDGHFDFAKVYVQGETPKNVTIAEGDTSIEIEDQIQLTLKVNPEDAIVNSDILWSSSNPKIASVDQNGTVTAHKVGKTRITVTLDNYQLTSEIILEVLPKHNAAYSKILDDMDEKFQYVGSWGVDENFDLFYSGTNHWTTTPNDYAILNFEGTGVELYGRVQPGLGIFDIYIDDVFITSIDGYSPDMIYHYKFFEKYDLEDGKHLLKIINTENKNPSSGGTQCSIDFAKIYHNTITPAADFEIGFDTMQLQLGDRLIIDPILEPVDSNEEVIWKSTSPEIVSIDAYGEVTANSLGTATIIGTIQNGTSHEINVTVVEESNLYAMFGNSNIHYLQKDYDEIVNKYRTEFNLYNSDFGWKNDQINALIVLFTKQSEINHVEVKATDFKNENGSIISNEQIQLNFLRENSVAIGQASPFNIHYDIPDILSDDTSINLEKERVRSVWMKVMIPENADPGYYTGNIQITSDEASVLLPYSFEVINLTQPSVDDYQGNLELWQYPNSVAKYYNIDDSELYGEKHLELLSQNIKEYRSAGGNTITASITEYPWGKGPRPYLYPSEVKWIQNEDGTFIFDFTHFDKWVELNISLGVDQRIKCFSMSPYHEMVYRDALTGEERYESLEVGSERWKEVWGQFLEVFIPHLDEKGWFDMTYTATDEVGESYINAIYELIQNYPNKDGKTLKLAAAVNYGNLSQTTLDHIDDISISLNHVDLSGDTTRQITEDRRSKGLTTSFYTCTGIYPNSFGYSNPGESAWTMWFNASQKMDGFLRWAYDCWLQNPYESLDFEAFESGDTMIIYPDEDHNAESPQIHATPRWEKLKEGKRDIEKIYYLEENYPELVDEIEQMLHSLKGSYTENDSSKELINQEVIRMRYELRRISKLVETDKGDLKEVIELANSLKKELYTNTSYETVQDELKLALELYNDEFADQDTINDQTLRLQNAINALEYKDADYTTLNAAILKASNLDKTLYKDFSEVEKALEAVVPDLDITHQEEVDAMAKAIEDAISALEYKDADYSAVEKAKEKVPADLSIYTEESVKALNDALAGVAEGKNITEQEEVDAMAKAIENAINGLVKKDTGKPEDPSEPTDPAIPVDPENPTTPADPETPSDPEGPNTSDNYQVAVFAGLMILSAGVLALMFIRRKRNVN